MHRSHTDRFQRMDRAKTPGIEAHTKTQTGISRKGAKTQRRDSSHKDTKAQRKTTHAETRRDLAPGNAGRLPSRGRCSGDASWGRDPMRRKTPVGVEIGSLSSAERRGPWRSGCEWRWSG